MRRHHFVVYMEGITTYVLNFTLKPIKYNNFWIWIRINEFKSDLQSFEQQEKSRLWVLIEVYYFLKNLYSFPGGGYQKWDENFANALWISNSIIKGAIIFEDGDYKYLSKYSISSLNYLPSLQTSSITSMNALWQSISAACFILPFLL